MHDGEAGRISRRTLLVGGASSVALLGVGAALAPHELDAHPQLRRAIFG
ncbi:MAG: hypothetical protein JO246_09670 [Frankiaceae bacterium]|nr:hypothetical protein [Frankiaceae bacterium]